MLSFYVLSCFWWWLYWLLFLIFCLFISIVIKLMLDFMWLYMILGLGLLSYFFTIYSGILYSFIFFCLSESSFTITLFQFFKPFSISCSIIMFFPGKQLEHAGFFASWNVMNSMSIACCWICLGGTLSHKSNINEWINFI